MTATESGTANRVAGIPDSLATVLRQRASTRPGDTAYEFLNIDGTVDTITYSALATTVTGLASKLTASARTAEPTMVLCPPGLGFVTALWAGLIAGTPTVPAFPPVGQDRVLSRFRHVLADAEPGTLLVDPSIAPLLPDVGSRTVILTTEQDTAPAADEFPTPTGVALVQYTSGSTSCPKGVVLRHDNLLHNIRAIADVFELDNASRGFSWLPPYHDMGLIGCILTPVYVGFPMRLMSPLHFLKSPLVWLRQISELGVTATGGPNFAYDLCVRRARGEPMADVDLSSWRVAFNGAEPVRANTMREFTERFSGNGFRASSFLPCYGLAEATLIVSGRHWDGSAHSRANCGPAISGHEIAVVDPNATTRLPDGEEGEIWLSGPSITPGYWQRHQPDLFGDLDGIRRLRTGDLGYLQAGELFVTGRRTDVLVHRGVNYHAQDIESAAVDGDPRLRPTAAAFMVDEPQTRPVLVVECVLARVDVDDVVQRLRQRVLEQVGLTIEVVVACPPRTIPRTTSGKVQRSLCRERFLSGELVGQTVAIHRSEPVQTKNASVRAVLENFVAEVFAAVCEQPSCKPSQGLVEIGGDSMRGAEIAAVLEDAIGLDVPVEMVLSCGTPARLADWLLGRGVSDTAILRRLAMLDAEERANT